MNKKTSFRIKIILIILAVITAVFFIFIFPRINNASTPSKPGQNGNSAGNLHNNGLFCENKGIIYFSNPSDDGTLYSMNSELTDFKKLSTDKIRYINVDDNYIYYSRINNMKKVPSDSIFIFFNTGLFRINKKGGKLQMISNKPIGLLNLFDNRLFYQHFEESKGISVHTADFNGDNDVQILIEDSIPASIYNNSIYYSATRTDHGVHRVNIDGSNDTLLINESSFMPIVNIRGIYYISTADNYSIFQSQTDGTERQLLVNGMCSAYNISSDGRYIFYQRDGSEQNGIYMFDTTLKESTLIASGDYKWLHTTTDYLFFYSFDGMFIYTYKPGGIVSTLIPPDLSE